MPPRTPEHPQEYQFPKRSGGPPKFPLAVRILGGALLLVVAIFCYWWFVQRVEVAPGEMLVLVRKVGASLPSDAGAAPGAALSEQVVLYPALLKQLGEPPNSTRYKGIIYEPLPEGRHFCDPFLWSRITAPAVMIAPDEIGILVRRYGRTLPPGRTVATEPDERGPELEVLKPGRYNVNPFAYHVLRVKPVIIPAGEIGVQTLLSGAEPANPNDYVVAAGERGVQPDILPPGMYYNNPYWRRIDAIDVRSHTIDLHGDDAIRFPSNDSFEVIVDATVEYAIRQDKAPYVMVAIGDHQDILQKLILPHSRSLCRIEGSKLLARDFISGETRTEFQRHVFEGLREQCYAQGIEIRATLIRRIVPPGEIAGPISDRQVAGQQIKQYENEIKLAQAEARLVEQEELQKQNQAVGEANREVVATIKQAEQEKSVALTEANQRLEVAKLNVQAAAEKAAALVSRGKAEAEVMLLEFQAQAEPLRNAVQAFGDGQKYAQYYLYQKLAPALKSVLASTDGPFADIFRAISPTEDHGPPGGGQSKQAAKSPAAESSELQQTPHAVQGGQP
jgi:regulator of protease activity HflC (stomatin/prohibitin superfamily)